MSKLVLELMVPDKYDKASFVKILREIGLQVNPLSEGRASARYQAQVAVPASAAASVSDITWDSNATVTNGTVRVGWICNVPSATNATFQEIRALAGSSLTLSQLNALVSDADLGLTLGTEVAATSGTSIDFTGIPSWAKKIIVQFVGLSTSGTSTPIIQIGDAGGVETTGYLGGTAVVGSGGTAAANHTDGFPAGATNSAASVAHGQATLTLEDAAGFTWVMSGVVAQSNADSIHYSAGSKSLSAALDRVRITTAGGTDTFDAGAINILYS